MSPASAAGPASVPPVFPVAPPFAAFAALYFCYFASIGTFNPYAPLWFKELGYSTLAIGAIASLQSWSRVLAPYAWSWFGDHGGQRTRLIRAAAAASLVCATGLLWARGHGAVAACTLMLFLANGGVVPLSEAALAQHLRTAQGMDTARYGRVRMWGSVGFIVAVAAFGPLLQTLGLDWFPLFVVAMYALLCVAAWRLPMARSERVDSANAAPMISVLRRPEVAWFFASIVFTVLAHTALYAFFSLYLDELGYDKSTVGLLWAASVLAEIAFFWAQGRFFSRISPHAWLQWAAAVSVLRFAMTAWGAASMWVLLAAQALHAITFAGQHAACVVLISRHFPGPMRGRGQALYAVLGYGVAGVVGGVAGGWLVTHAGFASVFWAAAAMAAVGWACAQRSSVWAARSSTS